MDYVLLTGRQLEQVHLQKLLALETDHARLELDLRLAHAVGVDGDDVAAAQAQLGIIVRQIATLVSWMTPPPPETEDEEPAEHELANPNGHRTAVE